MHDPDTDTALCGKPLRAYYYSDLLENEEHSPNRPLADCFNYTRFAMVTKAATEYIDSQDHRGARRSMGIEIAVVATEFSPHVDYVVLLAGDGDLRSQMECLRCGTV